MVYQVIYLQHNAPERVLGYVTANNYRHALAMVRHNPKYYDYDSDRLNVKIPPEKAEKRRIPMREEQMLLKLAKEVMAGEFEANFALNFLKHIEKGGRLLSERASARIRGLSHEVSRQDKSGLDKYDPAYFDEVVAIERALDELITRMDKV